MPLPLHISVFLFLTGLIFLFTTSNAMVIVLTIAVVLIGFIVRLSFGCGTVSRLFGLR
ncbi:hypothetical protein BGY98DRAFT_970837 [Russula aff. rugulosa BPL654]|nr:hypothetical protein BGY98DRAFT_970837 [Russula aff. rugulosa BPL654]